MQVEEHGDAALRGAVRAGECFERDAHGIVERPGLLADAGHGRRRYAVAYGYGASSRVDIRKTLVDKELGSKLTYFEVLQLLVEQQQELSVQKSHLREAEAAEAAIRETRRQAVAEYRRTLSDELAKAEQKANGLAQDLIKAEQRTRLQLLTAPVDGVVQ